MTIRGFKLDGDTLTVEGVDARTAASIIGMLAIGTVPAMRMAFDGLPRAVTLPTREDVIDAPSGSPLRTGTVEHVNQTAALAPAAPEPKKTTRKPAAAPAAAPATAPAVTEAAKPQTDTVVTPAPADGAADGKPKDPWGLAPAGADPDAPVATRPIEYDPETGDMRFADGTPKVEPAPATQAAPKEEPAKPIVQAPISSAVVEKANEKAQGLVSIDVAELAKMTKMRDILDALIVGGSKSVSDLIAKCKALKADVPVLSRVANIEERVVRTLGVMDHPFASDPMLASLGAN